MADNNEAQNQGMPTPDPALKRLNRLVGTWSMKGHPIGPDEDSITGTTHIQMAAEGRMMTVLGFSCSCMDTDYAGKPIESRTYRL